MFKLVVEHRGNNCLSNTCAGTSVQVNEALYKVKAMLERRGLPQHNTPICTCEITATKGLKSIFWALVSLLIH